MALVKTGYFGLGGIFLLRWISRKILDAPKCGTICFSNEEMTVYVLLKLLIQWTTQSWEVAHILLVIRVNIFC